MRHSRIRSSRLRPTRQQAAAPPSDPSRQKVLLEAFLNCRLTRWEKLLFPTLLVLTVALQLQPVLDSKYAFHLIAGMSVLSWTSPVTAFYFIACGQSLPFPESAPLNPAQIGALTWPFVILVTTRKFYFHSIVLLLPLLPSLFWTNMVLGPISELLSPDSNYLKALIYAVIALHYAHAARGRYALCLIGLCLGAFSVSAAYWASILGLPVDLYQHGINLDRKGYARLGAGRADSVSVWPPLVMGAFGLIGIAMSQLFVQRATSRGRKLFILAIVVFALSVPPLFATMTHGGYASFGLLMLVTGICIYREAVSPNLGAKSKKRLLHFMLIFFAGFWIAFTTNTLDIRARMNALVEYYQEQTEKASVMASRTEVWTYSMETILAHPLFGVEVSGKKEKIPSQYLSRGDFLSHNVFLDYGRSSGIPGILFIAYFFFYPIFRLLKHRRHRLYYGFYFAYFLMFIYWMTLSYLFYKTFWALWALITVMEVNMRAITRATNSKNPVKQRGTPRQPAKAAPPGHE